MTVIQSTPSKFVEALKKEQVEYPVVNKDFVPASKDKGMTFSGYFSARPAFKKQTKDYSALFHAQSRLFARKAIDQKATEKEIQEILSSNQASKEVIALAQSEDVIAGTAMGHVILDETYKLAIGFK
jgi:hypothetical protein